jgi:hypothetical protein
MRQINADYLRQSVGIRVTLWLPLFKSHIQPNLAREAEPIDNQTQAINR